MSGSAFPKSSPTGLYRAYLCRLFYGGKNGPLSHLLGNWGGSRVTLRDFWQPSWVDLFPTPGCFPKVAPPLLIPVLGGFHPGRPFWDSHLGQFIAQWNLSCWLKQEQGGLSANCTWELQHQFPNCCEHTRGGESSTIGLGSVRQRDYSQRLLNILSRPTIFYITRLWGNTYFGLWGGTFFAHLPSYIGPLAGTIHFQGGRTLLYGGDIAREGVLKNIFFTAWRNGALENIC